MRIFDQNDDLTIGTLFVVRLAATAIVALGVIWIFGSLCRMIEPTVVVPRWVKGLVGCWYVTRCLGDPHIFPMLHPKQEHS